MLFRSKRRCGWFDGVLVRQTIKISGIHGIALTKLDVLDELEEIKMCIGYELNGKKIDYLPAASEDQFNIKPIYKSFPGWKSKTQGIRNSYWQEIAFGDGFDVVPDKDNSRYGYAMSQQGNVSRYDWITGNNYTVRPTHPNPDIYLRFNWNAAGNPSRRMAFR